MEVQGWFVALQQNARPASKLPSDKIKNSKLFQSITPVYSALTSSGSNVAAVRR
jgi:hypothetical protein